MLNLSTIYVNGVVLAAFGFLVIHNELFGTLWSAWALIRAITAVSS